MTKATATSSGNTKSKKPDSGQKQVDKPVDTRIKVFSSGNTRRCRSSRRVVSWRPWVSVEPLVRWLEKHRFVVNRVLNEAFLEWVGGLGDEKLRLKARLFRLLDEERELRQTMRVILRSGAFLDGYAAKLVEGDEKLSVKLGRQPLAALASKEEVEIVKRILARREAVVSEICLIEKELLPKIEYELKGLRSLRSAKQKRRAGVNPRKAKCIDSDSPKGVVTDG